MQQNISWYSVWPLVIAGIVSSLLLGVVFTSAAYAEAKITLSPTTHRLDIAPNATYDGSLTVINSGSDPLDIRVYAAPYQVQSEAYDPIFSKDTPRTQISRWITFDKDSFKLEPKDQIKIPYKVKTPASIPDGGQYAAIFAETNEKPDGAIVRKKRVGMIIYAKADGETKEIGKTELAKPSMWHFASGLTVKQRLINEGNTDLTGDVKVRATNLSGDELFSNKQQKVVLPETTRSVPTEWQETPNIGIVKLTQSVDFAGKKTTQDQWIVIITPLWLLIISTAAVLIIGGIIYATRRSKKRTRIRRSR